MFTESLSKAPKSSRVISLLSCSDCGRTNIYRTSVSEEQQELRGLSAPRQSVFKRQWVAPGSHCVCSAVSGQYRVMVNMSQDPSWIPPGSLHLEGAGSHSNLSVG